MVPESHTPPICCSAPETRKYASLVAFKQPTPAHSPPVSPLRMLLLPIANPLLKMAPEPVLPETVLSVIVNVPPLYMAPPCPPIFAVKVLLLTVRGEEEMLSIAPPAATALLLVKVLPITFSCPEFWMAPP